MATSAMNRAAACAAAQAVRQAAETLTTQPHWLARVAAGTLEPGAAASVPEIAEAVRAERARQNGIRRARKGRHETWRRRAMPRLFAEHGPVRWRIATAGLCAGPFAEYGVPADAIYRDTRRDALAARAHWRGQRPVTWYWRERDVGSSRTLTECRGRRGRLSLSPWRGRWVLWDTDPDAGRAGLAAWDHRPPPPEYLRAARKYWRDRRPLPDQLGWRAFRWDASNCVLRSPQQDTPWHDAVLVATPWSTAAALRGEAGIHALHAPRGWRALPWTGAHYCTAPDVTALVERWGRCVLGEDGWRAEWCAIREIVAPATIAGAIQAAYPDVVVHVREQQKEMVS